jgi:hypothetical protein
LFAVLGQLKPTPVTSQKRQHEFHLILFFGYLGFGKHIMAISNVETSNNDTVFLHLSDFERARTPEGLSAIVSPAPEKRLKFRRGFRANTTNTYNA